MLEFDRVAFAYGREQDVRRALLDVSLSVAPGELVAVVGANGSGKSTLARLSNGLLVADSGAVSVDGVDVGDHALAREVRTRVAVVFQRPDDQIVATAVEDDVAFGPENLGLARAEIRRRVDEAIAAVGLTGLERAEPHLLSGGQKQRVAIAGALAMGATYLVLDEPTSMLDPAGRLEVTSVVNALRDSGHGVLLITHDLTEAASAQRVIVLDEGAVAFAGTIDELIGVADEQLEAWGLELPPAARLTRALRERGCEIPARVMDPRDIAEALCR